jgi:hypothetical protein
MSLKPAIKLAENLFNEGFIPSKTRSGKIYNVTTGEEQFPPQDVLEILEFICKFNEKTRSRISNN